MTWVDFHVWIFNEFRIFSMFLQRNFNFPNFDRELEINSFKNFNLRRIWRFFCIFIQRNLNFLKKTWNLHTKSFNVREKRRISNWIYTREPQKRLHLSPCFSFFLLHVPRSLNPQGCLIFRFFLFQFSFFLNHTVSLVQEIDFSTLIFHSFVFCGEIDLFVLFVSNLLTQIS